MLRIMLSEMNTSVSTLTNSFSFCFCTNMYAQMVVDINLYFLYKQGRNYAVLIFYMLNFACYRVLVFRIINRACKNKQNRSEKVDRGLCMNVES